MIIESSAPTRVDLAGGTIDIWPLYLFHPGASTVNFAINLRASCRIETRDDGRIVLESRDRQISFETELAALEDLLREERLELISKLVHFFKPSVGFHLVAHSKAPAGAGLGGSSALGIACIGALNRLVGNRYDARKFITIAANIETTVIRVPAGFQDYYSALYGGVSSIHYRPDGIEREALEVDEETLERRIAICYTGEPRMSGTNNWEITKNHIDGDAELFKLFDGIRDSAISVRAALLKNDWQAVSTTMREAYPNRKRLAPGVTTPQMEMLVEKALGAGAEASKVCGAGGGGCIAFLCAEGRRHDVERALLEEGVEVLDWKLAREGLVVHES
ncbi:MAG: D-glycero-alpha-D-manno-heptose-7-phosphate kinase [Acidobacteriota bacterium]|jgi:D-glycero-alpha-D-manno-heptose-7-phosphate kinase|nr:D-glycero-alpha-D-manno-heptose-7-phosphate kinase [Acidobacteriota bacterium]